MNINSFRAFTLLPLVLSLGLIVTPQKPLEKPAPAAANDRSGTMTMMIADEVRHRLVMLPYYGVFDWLEFELRPDKVGILRGEVTRPTTRSDAEARLKNIEGIAKVENQVEVLPASANDDRIRGAVYRSIFRYDGPMFRYATQSLVPIHIIVKNGNVTLKGYVDNDMDRQLAFMAANGISGVFEVKNELRIEGR